MTTSDFEPRLQARLALVDEHIGMENRHDIDGIMRTFGAVAQYDEEPWDDHHIGRDAVRGYYDGLLRAMPDLAIDVRQRHAAEAAVIVEVVISGHHRGLWRGLPPTGYRVEFPLCGVFTFDNENRLAGERIYYDRGTVLRQLGVFHEPDRVAGRIGTALLHPFTMARVVGNFFSPRR